MSEGIVVDESGNSLIGNLQSFDGIWADIRQIPTQALTGVRGQPTGSAS
jgi:hypothetical protein